MMFSHEEECAVPDAAFGKCRIAVFYFSSLDAKDSKLNSSEGFCYCSCCCFGM